MFIIAVLEDNDMIREAFARKIDLFMKEKKVDYQIYQYEHPDDFRTDMKNGIQFNLLWTDNGLPGGVNGITIMQRLLENGWKSPIILCSASGPDNVPEATVRLHKPATSEEIMDALTTCTKEILSG